jgi:hypothetical protein
VGDGERSEDDEGVGEVERRDGEQQPERVEREEGPEVEARCPVPPPQQVHALHRLAVHLKPRHTGAAAAQIRERCRTAGFRSALDADRGGVEGLERVYRLDSTRSDRRQQTPAGCVGGQPGGRLREVFVAGAESLRCSAQRFVHFLESPFSREPAKLCLTKTSPLKF